MKKLFALGAVLFAFAVPAASAQAAPISVDYCDYSLRGGGSLAPDNDVKLLWDSIEANERIDVVSSQAYDWIRYNDQDLVALWRYNTSAGSRWAYFECYRDNYSASGAYHDIRKRYLGSTYPGPF